MSPSRGSHKATASSSFCRADGQQRGAGRGALPISASGLREPAGGMGPARDSFMAPAWFQSCAPHSPAYTAGLHWTPSKPRFRHAIASPSGSFRPRQPDEPDRRSIAPRDRRGAHRRAARRLPSSRRLAEQLEVARNTVIRAYETLAIEGLAESRPASGMFVDRRRRRPAEDLVRAGRACPRAALVDADAGDTRRAPRRDGAAGRTRLAYRFRSRPRPPGALSAQAVATAPAGAACARRRRRPDRAGRSRRAAGAALGHRRPSCGHARRCRRSRPHHRHRRASRKGSRSRRACSFIAARRRRSRIPAPARRRWPSRPPEPRSSGSRWTRRGSMPDDLPQRPTALLYVTPSHQFPTGHVLSAERRDAIARGRGACGCYIVEDDSDGEFRYEGSPLRRRSPPTAPDCTHLPRHLFAHARGGLEARLPRRSRRASLTR